MKKEASRKVTNAYSNSHVFSVGDTVKVVDTFSEGEITKLIQNYCGKGTTWARVVTDSGFEVNYPLESLKRK